MQAATYQGIGITGKEHLNGAHSASGNFAVTYCVNEQIYFCFQHQKELHDAAVFAKHKTVPVLTNKFHQRIQGLRNQGSQNHILTVKDIGSQNKAQEAVEQFNEDLVSTMFGFCDRHPHLGYQYFDTEHSRPLCI